jgi:general secretion pathway protein J
VTDTRKNGFTLVEILVAVTLFSVVLLTVFTVFRTFLSTSGRVTTGLHHEERLRQGAQVMAADLVRVFVTQPPRYHPPDANQDPDRFRFAAGQTALDGRVFSHLQFASLHHLDLGPGHIPGVAVIRYYVHRHGTRFDLHRSDRMYLADAEPDPCRDPVLVKDVDTFSLTFTDRRGMDHPDWDSDAGRFENAFPVQVTIEIQTAGNHAGPPVSTAVFIPVDRQREP